MAQLRAGSTFLGAYSSSIFGGPLARKLKNDNKDEKHQFLCSLISILDKK
jgi:flagellar motor component MotA